MNMDVACHVREARHMREKLPTYLRFAGLAAIALAIVDYVSR